VSLSIFDDDDLVDSLGYSQTLDRGAHGMRWIRLNRRDVNGIATSGLGLSVRRSEYLPPPKKRDRVPKSVKTGITVKTGRSKRIEPREALAIIESRCSLSHLAKAYGVTRAAIAYYCRTVREAGPTALECVRRAMFDEVQMRLPGVTP
jgi:hypothetical protein